MTLFEGAGMPGARPHLRPVLTSERRFLSVGEKRHRTSVVGAGDVQRVGRIVSRGTEKPPARYMAAGAGMLRAPWRRRRGTRARTPPTHPIPMAEHSEVAAGCAHLFVRHA